MQTLDRVMWIGVSWLAVCGCAWAQDRTAEAASSAEGEDRATLSVAEAPQDVSATPGTAAPRLQLHESNAASPSEAREWFRLPLAVAYAAPVALIVTSLVLPRRFPASRGVLLLTGSSLLLLAPPVVHLLYDDAGGALGTLGGIVAFTLPLAALGAWWAYEACPNDYEDQCLGHVATGFAAGGLVGYATWAVLDTVLWAYAVKDPPQSSRLSPYIAPLFGSTRSDQARHVDGVVVGAIGAF